MTHRAARTFIGLVVLLALPFLALGAWGQPQTQPGSRPKGTRHQRLGGTIASVSGTTFVLTARGGRTVTVQTTSTTRIVGRQRAALTDLHAGDTVRIMATSAGQGTYTARAIQDLAGDATTPAQGRGGLWESGAGMIMIGGTIVRSPAGGSLRVATPVGQTVTVSIPASVRISRLISMSVSSLSAGMRVAVLGTPNADGSVNATTVFVAGNASK